MPCPLREAVRRFVRFQRRLGYAYACFESLLRPLDRWLADRGVRTPSEVTEQHLEQWLQVRSPRVAQSTLGHELSQLRVLYRFLHSRGHVVHDPTRSLPTVRPPQYVPFVFTVEQLRSLLVSGIRALRIPEARTLYYTLFHLLYATGLRVSEVLNLKVGDLDLERGVLHVRRTKFHKTRLVPLGRKVRQNLSAYLDLRRQRAGRLRRTDRVFVPPGRHQAGARLSYGAVRRTFRTMMRRIGLLQAREEHGFVRGQPRIHSLRHSFAVHRLLKWYREGVDVNQKLLLLSTYMGHSDVAHTQVYLTVSSVVLAEAQKRVAAYLAQGGRS